MNDLILFSYLYLPICYSLLSSTLQYSLHQHVWVSVTFPEPDIRAQRHSSLSLLALNPLVLEFPAPEAQVDLSDTQNSRLGSYSVYIIHLKWTWTYRVAHLVMLPHSQISDLDVLPYPYAYCERPGKKADKSCCLYLHVKCALFRL